MTMTIIAIATESMFCPFVQSCENATHYTNDMYYTIITVYTITIFRVASVKFKKWKPKMDFKNSGKLQFWSNFDGNGCTGKL